MKQISVDLNKLSWSEIEALARIANKGKEEVEEQKVQIEQPKERAKWGNRKSKTRGYFVEVKKLMDDGMPFKTAFEKASGRGVGGYDYRLYKNWLATGKINVKKAWGGKKTIKRKRKSREYYEKQDALFQPVYNYIKQNKVPFATGFRTINKVNPSGQQYNLYREFCKRKKLSILMPKKRGKHKISKATRSEKAKLNYLDNKFFEFKGRNIDKVKSKLGIKYKDALKILGHYWRQAEGDMAKAEGYLNSSYRKTFPTINKLDEKYTPILTSMLAKVIKDRSTLRRKFEGFAIGVEGGSNWEEFVTDFMLESKKIAEYFGIENKFKLVGTGSEARIMY